MKILHCIATLAGGGAERQLCYLTKGLIDAGHESHVVCRRLGANGSRLREAGAQIDLLSEISAYSPATLCRLLRIIRRYRPDIVQTWLCQMDVWGGIAARMTNIPWVLSERSSKAMYPRTIKNFSRLVVARGVTMIVANSRAGEEYWRQALGAMSTRMRVIQNALPLAEIEEAVPWRPENIQAKDKIILCAGRLAAEKNLRLLLRAFPVVLASMPARMLICGEGPEYPELRQLAADLGILERIHFLGYVGGLYGLMKAADVFVSVGQFEGQPNAVMEAMACRCPVVVSNIPEHREFLDDRSAFLTPIDSIDAVATHILRCLRSPDTAREKATIARGVAERWDIRTTVSGYVAAYRMISPHRDHH